MESSGGQDNLFEGRFDDDYQVGEITEPTTQTRQSINSASSGSAPALHDLSYLAGPPFAVPGTSTQPKRYFQGLAENAALLGISKSDLLRSDAQSPFTTIISATEDHSHLPASLRPTKIQHRYQHHPFWDCIPIPSFRDRTILAGAAKPPLINRFDVCWDLFAGGLTYDGACYDEGCWTFSPEFQQKWELLFACDVAELQRRADL